MGVHVWRRVVVAAVALSACAPEGLTGGVASAPPLSAEAGAFDGGGTDAGPADGRAGVDAAPETTPDAARDSANGADVATPDAGPACNPAADFGTPTPVAEVNTADSDLVSDLSADERTIYVSTNHGVSGVHIFYATRPSRAVPFGALVALLPLGAYDDWSIAVSSDRLTGILASDRSMTQTHLYLVTRSSVLSDFSPATMAAVVNSGADDATPRWTADQSSLYFDSMRGGDRDLYRAPVNAAGFGAPVAVTELNSPALEAAPLLSADERTIWFLSTRAPSPDGDVWTATRASKSGPFGAPTRVASLSSTAIDAPAWISADGCTMYLSSTRNGGQYDAFVARRGP